MKPGEVKDDSPAFAKDIAGFVPCPAVPDGQTSEYRPPRVVKEAEPVPAHSAHRFT